MNPEAAMNPISEAIGHRRKAAYQEPMPHGQVRCLLCPHQCVLPPGQVSRCLSRENHDGTLMVRNYGMVTSLALDPIEKKPLARFHPGRQILSVGTFGCNFTCQFCQNWQISQQEVPGRFIPPVELLRLAKETVADGNIGVAFTYNEPTIWYEYVRDCAMLLHEAGLAPVLVTNGFINLAPLLALLPHVDAMNVDIKAFRPEFYQKLCGGRLEPVLETVKHAHAHCHVEVTTLVIPGLNDDESEIDALAAWLANLSPHIPLHLSRHHPDWHMTEPAPIGIPRLKKLAEIAHRHLDTVILGNV